MAQTIVVTGAGTGIGAATARQFLNAGWNVALIGRREAPLQEVADGSERALVAPCDVSDAQAVDRAFAQIAGHFGRIDCLFNNAGMGLPGQTPDKVSIADWDKVVGVNLNGAFYCARAAFAQMRAQDPQGGRIINNGSISATAPRPGSVAYTTTKHAITGMTKTFALDGRAFDIACGQIDIGNAETEMVAKMKSGIQQADGSIRAEAVMDVDHVAQAVLHMAELPLASNVLFQTIMATKMPFVGRG